MMPLLAVFAAGAFAGLWVRSETDTNGSAWQSTAVWVVIAAGGLVGARYLMKRYRHG